MNMKENEWIVMNSYEKCCFRGKFILEFSSYESSYEIGEKYNPTLKS